LDFALHALRVGTRLATGTRMMIWIALLPSLLAGWMFVGALRLRRAEAR